jgi:hypothetical protein
MLAGAIQPLYEEPVRKFLVQKVHRSPGKVLDQATFAPPLLSTVGEKRNYLLLCFHVVSRDVRRG